TSPRPKGKLPTLFFTIAATLFGLVICSAALVISFTGVNTVLATFVTDPRICAPVCIPALTIPPTVDVTALTALLAVPTILPVIEEILVIWDEVKSVIPDNVSVRGRLTVSIAFLLVEVTNTTASSAFFVTPLRPEVRLVEVPFTILPIPPAISDRLLVAVEAVFEIEF